MQIDKLLDLLLYAVNEANGWSDESRGRPIKSPEMAQCVAVLAASGRHPIDYGDTRLTKEQRDEFASFMMEVNPLLQELATVKDNTTRIRVSMPAIAWRRLGGEHDRV